MTAEFKLLRSCEKVNFGKGLLHTERTYYEDGKEK
jgi:hypothetical protein